MREASRFAANFTLNAISMLKLKRNELDFFHILLQASA